MIKRVMIGLIALAGVALWWTDARTQCSGGVGSGGSCRTSTLLGRSLACVSRTTESGSLECEFFGTLGPSCNHNFNTGVLDRDCRIRGTAYCDPAGTSSLFSVSSSSSDDDDDDDDDGGAPVLQKKRQTLAAGSVVHNLGSGVSTRESSSGNPPTGGSSHWAVAELEATECATCPDGTSFLTFIAEAVVMRTTFCPDTYSNPCHTTIQVCTGGGGLEPTEINSYDCRTVFECEFAQGGGPSGCSTTIGTFVENCHPSD
jgi:hypothetical protein